MSFIKKLFDTSDPIESWLRNVISILPKNKGIKESKISTIEMLEEGLGLYLSLEQEQTIAVHSLVPYFVYEGIPIPEEVIEELTYYADKETLILIKGIKENESQTVSIKEFISSLVDVTQGV